MKTYRSQSFLKLDSKQILGAILAAGIALRISGLTASAIWYDEAISFEAAKLPFFSMLDATRFTFSPPLWGTIVWLSVRLFGQNELGLRLPALFAGISLLWMTYQTISDFRLSEYQNIVVIGFAAFLPYQLAMAQDGRMYTLFATLYLCAIWFARRNRWLGLTACSGLLLYTHYTAIFYLIAIYLIAAINHLSNRKHLVKIFASGLISILSFLPWLGVYISTLAIESPVGPISIKSLLIMFYQGTFDGTITQTPFYPLALVAIFGSVIFGLFFSINMVFSLVHEATRVDSVRPLFVRRKLVHYVQLTLFALLPITIMVVWSFVWKNFLYYRLIVSTIIPMIIWAVYNIAQSSKLRQLNYVLLSCWTVCILAGIVLWSPQAKTGDLHDIANFVNEQWQNGDVIYHITGTSYLPFSQYLGNKPQYLIDEKQHDWLLPIQLQDRFGIKRSSLESIPYQRAWIFFSRDGLISQQANERAQKYIHDATLIGVVKAWRFSSIEVYLLTTHVSP